LFRRLRRGEREGGEGSERKEGRRLGSGWRRRRDRARETKEQGFGF